MGNIKSNDDNFYCPLLKKVIELGICLDINYERENYFKTGIIKEMEKSIEEANHECNNCPKNPFDFVK